MNKFLYLCIICILILNFTMPITKANQDINESNSNNSEETLEEQKDEFEINNFIKEAEKYTGSFFDDMDIGEILEDAIKGEINNRTIVNKIFSILSGELINGMKVLGSILVIIVLHSILKAIGENLENSTISKMVYYVQYILIVTIVMINFSDIVKDVKNTCNNLIGFMNILIPLLISMMIYTGSIITSGVLEPIILFFINFIGNIIQNFIIPMVLVFTSLIVISKISENVQILKLSNFLKSGIVWFFGILITVFVGIISLEGTLSSTVDRYNS